MSLSFKDTTSIPPVKEMTYVDLSGLSELNPEYRPSYNLTIAFLGFNQSSFNLSLMESTLPSWYAPIDRIPSSYSGSFSFRANYSVSYSTIFLGGSDISQYSNFIHSIADTGPKPGFDSIVNNPVFDNFTSFDYVPTDPVERYLNDTYSFTWNSPTIFIIDTYSYNQSQFIPYYYNSSEFDIDLPYVPRPYGSQYMVAGGGHYDDILWMDISAGPTEYRGATWNHTSVYNGNVTALTSDIASYISSAFELRFLPSYIYRPLDPSKEVKFEFLLVDLAQGSTNWGNVFNPEYIVAQYSRVNPGMSWSYSFSEWDYSNDSGFLNTLQSAKSNTSHVYDSWKILGYLDSVYSLLFNTSTDLVTVVPMFLFGFPDDWMFDSFLGIANSDSNGNFSYVVNAANERWVNMGYDIKQIDWYNSYGTPSTISPGQILYIQSNSYEGLIPDIFQTNLTTSAPTLVDIVDASNFKLASSGKNYSAISSFVGNGSFVFNTTLPYISKYYWLIQPATSTPVTYEMKIDTFSNRAFGFSFVAMHEGGHALGLSHPHDGWSWQKNSGIFDWLWDLSYSQMTYGAHLANVSYMDIQTLQRGMFELVRSEIIPLYNQLVKTVKENNSYLPLSLYEQIESIRDIIVDGTINFTSFSRNAATNDLAYSVINSFVSAKRQVQALIQQVPTWLFSVNFDVLTDSGNTTFDLVLNKTSVVVGGVLSDVLTHLQSIGYVDYNLTIYENGTQIAVLSGGTWELDGLTLDFRSSTSSSTTTSVNSTTSSTSTSSTTTSSTPTSSTTTSSTPTSSTTTSSIPTSSTTTSSTPTSSTTASSTPTTNQPASLQIMLVPLVAITTIFVLTRRRKI